MSPFHYKALSNQTIIPPDLLVSDLIDLPIGILICEKTHSARSSTQLLTITYCNTYASTLFINSDSPETPVFFDDSPFLRTLSQSVHTVLETGVPITTETYEPTFGCRIESSIKRVREKCHIYLKTSPVQAEDAIQPSRQSTLDVPVAGKSNRLVHSQSNKIDTQVVESLAQISHYSKADILYDEEVNEQLIRKAAELDKSNQLLRAVIDTIPTGLALLQPIVSDDRIIDFRYVLNNPASAVITGLSQEEMIGKSLLAMFPHLGRNGVFGSMVKVAQTGESQRFQLLDQLPTGAFWGEFSLVRVEKDILFSVTNITHTKQVEEELRLTNSVLQSSVAERTTQIQQLSALQHALLNHAGLAIMAIDLQGIIQLVNPAAEALTGFSADELIGKFTPGELREPSIHQQKIDQLKPTLDNPILTNEEVVKAYIQKHKFLRRENILLTKAGKHIPVISTVSGLYDDQKNLIGYVDMVTDISYQKTIEKELLKAEQRSQLAIKAGKIGVWELNLLTNEFELEEDFYANFDLPANTRIHKLDDLKHLLHPDDSIHFQRYVEEIKAGRTSFNAEFRLILPITKVIHYIKADGLVVQDTSGSSHRMIGIIQDRTTKRQAERALLTSEKRYRSLVTHLKEIVFQTDASGLWTYLNPAWEEITGFSIDESLGKFFLDSILPEDHADTHELFQKIRSNQASYVKHVIRYIHKSGGFRWIDVLARVMLNEQQEFMGVTGTLTDITASKLAQEALEESEQRFREIAENVDEIFWIRDLHEPKFLYVNSAFEKFCGQAPAALYANPMLFLGFIVEEDRIVVRDAFMNTEPGTTFRFRGRHQDGSIRWLDAHIFTVTNEDGVLTRRLGVARDITTVIEKELILEKSLEKERTLNALKSQFISTASHEFRTPLTAISSSIELAKYYANLSTDRSFTPLINKHADTISQQVHALNELITDTLTISKIEEGKISINLESTDVVELINALIEVNFCDREDLRQVDTQIIGQPYNVNLDKKLTNHVLLNLLSNAFKFSSENPMLTIQFDKEKMTINISDKGIGIPEKDIPSLFNKFFRASNAGSIQGTGLGLAICQEYVALQKGLIDVVSTEKVGTTFKVIFPFFN